MRSAATIICVTVRFSVASPGGACHGALTGGNEAPAIRRREMANDKKKRWKIEGKSQRFSIAVTREDAIRLLAASAAIKAAGDAADREYAARRQAAA